ncbi:MAG: KH domain-containing protein [Firmicutes bacterium]|nr:KH domain-containing protein [Bacillota bacterium]
MRDLVEVLTRALVDHPEQVDVKEVESESSVVVEVRVAPDDVGKIIGRQGRIARAIRTVVKAVAARDGKRASVEILS